MLRKKHIYTLFAAGFLAFCAAPAALAAPQGSSAAGLLRAVNTTRASFGLRPLTLDVRLGRAARSHTAEMLRGNSFSHGDFHGRMVTFGVRGSFAGENLAWGSGTFAAAGTIVKEWLASPGHRANLLKPGYRRIGLGIGRGTFQGAAGATVVTADFAG